MKKIFLLSLTSLLCANDLSAQTKDQILVYGSVSASMMKSEWGEKSFYLQGAPGVGYNLSDNWAVGITGVYTMHNRVDSGTAALKSKNANWAVGPFVRYTQPLGELFFIYGQFELGYGQETAGTLRGIAYPKPDAYRVSASFYPSVGMDLDNGFALNFAFGGLTYNYSKAKAVPDPAHFLNLNFGSAFQFGVSKFFGDNGRANAYRNY